MRRILEDFREGYSCHILVYFDGNGNTSQNLKPIDLIAIFFFHYFSEELETLSGGVRLINLNLWYVVFVGPSTGLHNAA